MTPELSCSTSILDHCGMQTPRPTPAQLSPSFPVVFSTHSMPSQLPPGASPRPTGPDFGQGLILSASSLQLRHGDPAAAGSSTSALSTGPTLHTLGLTSSSIMNLGGGGGATSGGGGGYATGTRDPKCMCVVVEENVLKPSEVCESDR